MSLYVEEQKLFEKLKRLVRKEKNIREINEKN